MATVMELMRELKHLGELKKAGQITPELEQRMGQLKSGQVGRQLIDERCLALFFLGLLLLLPAWLLWL